MFYCPKWGLCYIPFPVPCPLSPFSRKTVALIKPVAYQELP